MRARVLSFSAESDDLESQLNAWLEEVGDIVIENSLMTLAPVALPISKMVVFYRERTVQDARPRQAPPLCAQCRKNPPANGLKTCQACQDYQRDYRQKRKQESKTRYP